MLFEMGRMEHGEWNMENGTRKMKMESGYGILPSSVNLFHPFSLFLYPPILFKKPCLYIRPTGISCC
jgi:hypothetical protein